MASPPFPPLPLHQAILAAGRNQGAKAARLLKQLRERQVAASSRKKPLTAAELRMRKRKTALALSAGAVALTATTYNPLTQESVTANAQAPVMRTSALLLRASDALKRAMVEEEGVRDRVYRDVAGYPTVGVGHLVKPEDGLKVGDHVSRERILDFLERDLDIAEHAVARLVGNLPLLQHEYDALVDLVFNVGEGNILPGKSPRLNQAIAERDYQGIAEELHYHHAGGAIANGLIYRSERRAQIFTEASYEDPRTRDEAQRTLQQV